MIKVSQLTNPLWSPPPPDSDSDSELSVDEHSSSYASSHSSDSEDDDIDVKPKWNNERQPVHSTPKGMCGPTGATGEAQSVLSEVL